MGRATDIKIDSHAGHKVYTILGRYDLISVALILVCVLSLCGMLIIARSVRPSRAAPKKMF